MRLISAIPYLAPPTLALAVPPEASPQSAELKPEQCLGGLAYSVLKDFFDRSVK